MADRFRESGGIEPLIDGPVGNTIRLAGNKIRIFEVIAVILAVSHSDRRTADCRNNTGRS